MAVTLSYQTWASASYAWSNASADNPPMQINDLLQGWVTAVNANPSNADQQVSILKTPSSSTAANYFGWVVGFIDDREIPGSTYKKTFYHRFYSSSTTNINSTFSEGFTDNGTNGGYGASSGGNSADTSIAWYTSGYTAEFLVASETVDGEEFFAVGWKLNNSTSYSDSFVYFKDNNGNWASAFNDGGTWITSYFMPVHPTPRRNFAGGIAGAASVYAERFGIYAVNATSAPTLAGQKFTGRVIAASDGLYRCSTNAGFGKWFQLDDGRYAVNMSYNDMWVVYS
jgi:hypothetical protein